MEYCWHNRVNSSATAESLADPSTSDVDASSSSSSSESAAPAAGTGAVASVALKAHHGMTHAGQARDISQTSACSSSSATSSSTTTSSLVHTPSSVDNDAELVSCLRGYLQLDTDLALLYQAWSNADSRMATVTACLPGMRILRQDPVECLFSFICSSNNNISRITQMLERLRSTYGSSLCEVGGHKYHSFPSIESLAAASEAELRALGLGYRAKFIRNSASKLLAMSGSQYLLSLRGQPRADVLASLLHFDGVGRKVADCVALFSLDQRSAIPVDTHVWAIACCYYDRSLTQAKSLTPAIYDRVGELFRSRYGEYAGWAHSLLFAAELPSYRSLLPEELRSEMVSFRNSEKIQKAEAKRVKNERKRARDESGASGGAGASAGVTAAALNDEENAGQDDVMDDDEYDAANASNTSIENNNNSIDSSQVGADLDASVFSANSEAPLPSAPRYGMVLSMTSPAPCTSKRSRATNSASPTAALSASATDAASMSFAVSPAAAASSAAKRRTKSPRAPASSAAE